MDFSIVIVTYNRKKYLERCLDSIRLNSSTDLRFETIVIFNGESSYFNSICNKYSECKCYYIPATTPAEARNKGVEKCSGRLIFFLDDDCHLPANYFSRVPFHEAWDVLGGPDMTPPDASSFEESLGLALSSPLCMGLTYKRHTLESKKEAKESDETSLILCNLWFKRTLFLDEGFRFSSDLFRCEENYLLKLLKEKGKILYYASSLGVYHTRKRDLRSLSLSIMKSGECRVKNFSKLPQRKELLYFLPLIFSGCLFFTISTSYLPFIMLFGLYTLAVLGLMAWKHRCVNFLVLYLHYHILLFYSLGLLVGFKNFIFKHCLSLPEKI